MTDSKIFLVKAKVDNITQWFPQNKELTKEVEEKIKKKVLDSGLTYPEYVIEQVFKELKKLEMI